MESNDASGSRKPMKRKRGKIQLSVSKDSVLSQSIASDDGCLSLLRKMEFDGSLPRVVGKRTPRVPVDYSNKSMKSPFDVNDGEVAPVAALALTKAAQKGGSPQVSQTLYKRSKQKSSVQSGERMVRLEGTIESRNEKGDYARDTCSALNMEGIGTAKAHLRGENIHGKKVRMKTLENHLHDGGEAHSGMEEGLDFSLKEKVDIEVTNAKPEHFYLESQRKRSKELLSGDESSALDALQTLANVSLMVLASTTEPELSVQLNEEKMTVDEDEKSALPETSTSQNRDESKLLGLEQKVVHAVPAVDVSTSKTSKLRREPVNNTNALVESKEKLPADRSWKRKRKLKVSKPYQCHHLHHSFATDRGMVEVF
ncbi:hypothetical protein VNO77_18366 [Canavalia gladiata]|uniref:Uncharacterized protein n=1 Tax=Canavalia gladiata TaxID=3824 RepID=A0AAN9LP49_CANGL